MIPSSPYRYEKEKLVNPQSGGFRQWIQQRQLRGSRSVVNKSTSSRSLQECSLNRINHCDNFEKLRLIAQLYSENNYEKLWQYVFASHSNPSFAQLSSNALSALITTKIAIVDKVFDRLSFPRASLVGGVFQRVAWKSVDLTNVDIQNTHALRMLVDSCRLSCVRLGELPNFRGHREWVETFVLSSDGKYLFSGGPRDNEVLIWDFEKYHLVNRITLPVGITGTRVLAIDPEAKWLAVGTENSSIALISLENISLKHVIEVGKRIDSLQFSLDGRFLTSASSEIQLEGDRKSIQIWMVERKSAYGHNLSFNDKPLKLPAVQLQSLSSNPTQSVYPISVDDKNFWVCLCGNKIVIANDDFTHEHTSKSYPGVERSLHFSSFAHCQSSGYCAAALCDPYNYQADEESLILIWKTEDLFKNEDVSVLLPLHRLHGHLGRVVSLDFSRSGYLLSAGVDGNIFVWSVDKQQIITTYSSMQEAIKKAQFSFDETKIIACRGVLGIRTLTKNGVANAGVNIFPFDLSRKVRLLGVHQHPVISLQSSFEGDKVVSMSKDRTLYFYSTRTGQLYSSLFLTDIPFKGVFNDFSFSRDEKLFAIAGDRSIWVINREKKNDYFTLEANKHEAKKLVISPDGRILASGGANGSILLWDLEVRQVKHCLTSSVGSVEVGEIVFSLNGFFIAAADFAPYGEEGVVSIWSTETAELFHSLSGDIAATFSKDGKYFACYNTVKKSLKILELARKVEYSIDLPSEDISSFKYIAFLEESEFVAFMFENKTFSILNWKERCAIADCDFNIPVTSLELLENKTVVVGGKDGSVSLWDLQPCFQGGEATLKWGYFREFFWSQTKVQNPIELDLFGKIVLEQKGVSVEEASISSVGLNYCELVSCSTLTKYNASIHALAITPDGKLMGSVGNDGDIFIWGETGNVEATLAPRKQRVTALLATNSTVLAGLSGGDVSMYTSLDDYYQVAKHTLCVSKLTALSLGRFASASFDKTIKIFDESAGVAMTLRGHSAPVVDLIALDNNFVISAAMDSTIRIWDLASGLCVKHCQVEESEKIRLALLGEDQLASSCGRYIYIWNLESLNLVEKYEVEGERIDMIVALPKSKGLLACVVGATILIIDDKGNKIKKLSTDHKGVIDSCIVDAQGSLISADSHGLICKWSFASNSPIQQVRV